MAAPADAARPRPRWLRSGRARLLLGVLALYLLWQAWLSIAAPSKVSPEIERGKPRVNVMVSLPFEPERFHVLMFQKYGRVSGTAGNTVEVRGVPQEQLHAMARHYWVSRIDPLPPDQ
ncbi:hypothetical protein [Pseudorhodoferax sp.]|uniref:hypothetical protein n=1 Tax=Pseudorhodoferax sp. TaxID=1993553 RepID=UPI002DD6393A|nr:hypothetical protein [Pseudorhodoferax sp.]